MGAIISIDVNKGAREWFSHSCNERTLHSVASRR